jgi:hypothetical protein
MFVARVAQIAMRVDAIAIVEITSGPASLQKRSIRRILAFNTIQVSAMPCFRTPVSKTNLDALIRSPR